MTGETKEGRSIETAADDRWREENRQDKNEKKKEEKRKRKKRDPDQKRSKRSEPAKRKKRRRNVYGGSPADAGKDKEAQPSA